jgi:hypothetical protein
MINIIAAQTSMSLHFHRSFFSYPTNGMHRQQHRQPDPHHELIRPHHTRDGGNDCFVMIIEYRQILLFHTGEILDSLQ